MRLRRWAVVTIASGVLAAAATLPASVRLASAHSNNYSQGCTAANSGYTCFGIYGIAGTTHVDSFIQSRGKSWAICNYYARFTVAQAGYIYWARNSGYHQGCVYGGRATRTVGVEQNFRNGSVGCGSWYEDGARIGTACLDIYNR